MSARAARGATKERTFPPARPDAAALPEARDRLRAIGYDEARVAERLGAAHVGALDPGRLPVYRARLARRPDALGTATALLLLGDAVPREAAAEALGAGALGALEAAGLLRRAGRGGVRSAAAIYPCQGLAIATDHRFGRPARDSVMYLGGDSYALAALAPTPTPRASARGEARVLDLCTGSGVHAVLAAARGARAIGVDVSARAVAFARFNAALNGVASRCELRRGDLWSALRGMEGERFDLILANPPFVPSPNAARGRILYRDAGPSGEDVLRRIVEGLPARLAPEGTAAIVSVFVSERDRPFRRKLEAWLGPRAELDALLLRLGREDPESYAAAQAGRGAAGFERWLAALERARVERIEGGVLALRRRLGPTPPAYRAVDAVLPDPADGRALPRALDALAAARSIVFPEELLDRRVRRAEDVVLVDELEARGGDLVPVRHRARLRGGALAPVAISRELRAVLAAVDGERSLREAVAAVARDGDQDALPLRIFADLAELVERGLLVPA